MKDIQETYSRRALTYSDISTFLLPQHYSQAILYFKPY